MIGHELVRLRIEDRIREADGRRRVRRIRFTRRPLASAPETPTWS
jgi:hypothetical protein